MKEVTTSETKVFIFSLMIMKIKRATPIRTINNGILLFLRG